MAARTVAVVGAGRGLGLSLARRFGREGFKVGLVARRREPLEEMVATLQAEGVETAAFPADVSDAQALSGALSAMDASLGPIDVLEFSPVPAPEGDAEFYAPTRLDEATMNRLHRLVVLGAITCVQAVLPGMRSRGRGSILLTTSGSAHHVMPVYTPVGMVMSALRSYALCLNEVTASEGVYVGSLCIGVLIRPGGGAGDPDALADRYWRMHAERGPAEVIVREDVDLNALHDRDMAEREIDWRRPDATGS